MSKAAVKRAPMFMASSALDRVEAVYDEVADDGVAAPRSHVQLDLAVCLVIVAFAFVTTWLDVAIILRLPLVSAVVLFIPGYALVVGAHGRVRSFRARADDGRDRGQRRA